MQTVAWFSDGVGSAVHQLSSAQHCTTQLSSAQLSTAQHSSQCRAGSQWPHPSWSGGGLELSPSGLADAVLADLLPSVLRREPSQPFLQIFPGVGLIMKGLI